MDKIVCVSKEQEKIYSTDEVKRVFQSTDDIKEIEKYVEKASDRLYTSWASVDGKDKDGERIPVELVIKTQETFFSRGAPLHDSHSNKPIGKSIAYKVMNEPKTGKLGVLYLNKVFRDYPTDDKAWENISKGIHTGSSVGGFGTIGGKEYDNESKSMVDVYTSFGQYEISSCKTPSNPLSLNGAHSAVAKEFKMTEDNKIAEIMKEFKDSVSTLNSSISTLNETLEVQKAEKKQEAEAVEKTNFETLKEELSELKKAVSDMKEITKEEAKEEDKEEDKTEDVEKSTEEVISMEAPAMKTPKEEENLDIAKQYNDVMEKFEKGEATYEEVLKNFRGRQ